MEVPTILKALTRFTGRLPHRALREAIAQREAVTPHLLEALELAHDRVGQLPGDDSLHTWALFLLAQFREMRALPLVVRLAELPSPLLDRLLGEVLTESLGRVLASVAGGDAGPLEQLAANESADPYARDAALTAMVCRVVAGQRTREETLDWFRLLLRTATAEPGSYFWTGLVTHATALYPDRVRTEIHQAFARRLPDPYYIRLSRVEETLARGREAVWVELLASPQYRLVEDAIAEAKGCACFRSQSRSSLRRA